ncbi:hypothetical protein [Marinimicrobium locisalis]|uniref:hypothetical protein n=1 Tax=Marinimicrobium locisalis TaxID=546022 RepID=UPI003221CE21
MNKLPNAPVAPKSFMGLAGKLSTFLLVALLAHTADAKKTVRGEVARIYPASNAIHFRLKNDDCISGSQYYYFNLTDASGEASELSKAWYALLLSASVSGKGIAVSVEECLDEGRIPVRYIYQDF